MSTAFRERVALFPDRLALYRVPVFAALARCLAERGLDLTVHTASKRSVATIPSAIELRPLNEFGFPVVSVREISMSGIVFWQSGSLLAAVGSRYQTLVLWGEAHRISTWMAILAGRARGKRVIVWGHGLYGREGRVKRILRVALHRLASHSILYGRRAQVLLARAGIPVARMTVVHNALDYFAITFARESVAAQQQALRGDEPPSGLPHAVLYVGRLVGDKRLDVLLDAIAEFLKGEGSVQLRLVGEGPERESLEKRVRVLRIEQHVDFVGALYDEEKLALEFMAADVVVSPGNVGLLAVHAHAYGIPVVTHDDLEWQMPEFEVIERGVTGAFFKRNDSSDLARVLHSWLTDQAGNLNVRERCIARVEAAFTPERVAACAADAIVAR